jgi:fatty-acid desaturase
MRRLATRQFTILHLVAAVAISAGLFALVRAIPALLVVAVVALVAFVLLLLMIFSMISIGLVFDRLLGRRAVRPSPSACPLWDRDLDG